MGYISTSITSRAIDIDTHIFHHRSIIISRAIRLRRRLGIPRDNAFELLLPGTPKLILTPIFFNRTVKKFISGGIFYPPFPSFPSFSFSLPSFPFPFPLFEAKRPPCLWTAVSSPSGIRGGALAANTFMVYLEPGERVYCLQIFYFRWTNSGN